MKFTKRHLFQMNMYVAKTSGNLMRQREIKDQKKNTTQQLQQLLQH
jgi:hypothetical protein